MSKKRYNNRASASEVLAALFCRQGVDLDPERLADHVEANRSRSKVNQAASVQHMEDLGAMVRRARRLCELAEWDWRRNPSADNLAAARAAQQARKAAEDDLRDACLGDSDLMSAVARGGNFAAPDPDRSARGNSDALSAAEGLDRKSRLCRCIPCQERRQADYLRSQGKTR